jgi:hypothetical protein
MSNLRGNLSSISLTDVAQLLHVNKKTGLLKVTSGKIAGTLYVVNGEVIHADTPHSKGETAAFEILEWDKGEFEFIAMKVQAPSSIRRSVPDLLMESARTSDSRKRFRSLFPSLKSVPWPTLRGDVLLDGIKIYLEDRKIIPFFDGYRDFLDVMATTELSEVAVLQAASILYDAGRLKLIEPEVQVNVVTLKTGFFKKGDHLEAPKSLEAQWRQLEPYSNAPITNVRVMWAHGPAVDPIQFVTGMNDFTIAISKDLLGAWGLNEGDVVQVRPAP